MKEQEIKLINDAEHINQFLTHWTGRDKTDDTAFFILSKIVNSGQLKFSSNPISFPSNNWTFNGKMICFTDTPIALSIDHCRRYNYFGLSFNKQKLIEYGANSVFYLVDNRQKSLDFMITVRPYDNELLNLANWISSSFQPYDSKKFSKDNWAEFYEREWRITRVLPYKWIGLAEQSRGQFNEYPYQGKILGEIISDKPDDIEFYLEFDKSIIENIIIPSTFEKSKAIKLIEDNNLDCELIILKT